MEIMDPYTTELLSAVELPAAFSGCGAAHQTDFDDDYLRAIGALLPRSRAGFAPASDDFPATLEPSSMMLPPSCELLDADVIQHAVEVRRKRAAPASDVAASTNAAKRPRTCPWLLYHLAPGTLHRAVSYVDRVLSVRALPTADIDYEFRLLGAAAVFTAAKYEERNTILRFNAADVAAYCGFATSKELTDKEREMLATLRYELSGPTSYAFVDHFTRNSRGAKNMEIRRLAHLLADTSLRDYGCLQFMPSAVAATALFLARLILNPMDNQEYFEDLTGYKPMDLVDGIYSLIRMNPNSRSVILPALRQYL